MMLISVDLGWGGGEDRVEDLVGCGGGEKLIEGLGWGGGEDRLGSVDDFAGWCDAEVAVLELDDEAGNVFCKKVAKSGRSAEHTRKHYKVIIITAVVLSRQRRCLETLEAGFFAASPSLQPCRLLLEFALKWQATLLISNCTTATARTPSVRNIEVPWSHR